MNPDGRSVLERHVGRVDAVVLAVVALDADVDDGEAVRAAGVHRFLDALLHGGDVVAGDRAADDRVDELESGATLQRADPQVGDGVLAVAAGLLLDLALGIAGADHGLAIRHTNIFGLDTHTELARQSLERDRKVRVAGAAEHGLVGVVAVDAEARILGEQAVQRARQLVVVGLRQRLQRQAEHRRGRLLADDAHRHVARRQRGAGGRVGRAWRPRRCRRRPRATHGNWSLPRMWNRPCSRSSAEVVLAISRSSVRDRAGDDLAQRHLADELVGDGLEDVRQRLRAGVGRHLDLLGAGDRPTSVDRPGRDRSRR